MHTTPYTMCPLAHAREAERLRHMARRARRQAELAGPVWSGDRETARLEARALALLARSRRLDS